MTNRLFNRFEPEDRLRLRLYYGAIAAAHLVGWGIVIWLSLRTPSLIGLGLLAYTFGLRHGFDADHISAIDNVTRKLIHAKSNSIGTGFFFSLGHSTIVFIAAVVFGLGTEGLFHGASKEMARYGGVIGTVVSGLCLVIIGLINLRVFTELLRERRRGAATQTPPSIDAIQTGGPLFRLFGRLFRAVRSSRQMYPIGFLFGLGFDTASEIALLAISAAAAAQGVSFLAVIALPVLFAAGMALMDTTDSLLMTKAYTWASADARRGSRYNLVVTGISVGVALTVGVIELVKELLPVAASSGLAEWAAAHISSWSVGLALVLLFAGVWTATAIAARRHRSYGEAPE